MKKFLILWMMSCAMATVVYAQDDDVYFVPSSKPVEVKKAARAQYTPIGEKQAETDDWSAGRTDVNWDVDAYNRRGTANSDTVADGYVPDNDADGTYTARLVRFHSPSFGVLVSSPYYVDYYDLWYTPWYYDSWYGYYGGWYGWGWRPYWSSWWGWHHPWWDYGWGGWPGWHHPGPGWHTPAWSVNSRPSRQMANHRVTSYRPSRDYASARSFSGNTRPSSGYDRGMSRPSRTYGTSGTTPSRTYGNSSGNRPSRTFGTSGSSRSNSGSTPSRSNGSSSTRSYSSPSNGSAGRSFGSGGGAGRSGGGNGGGGRSFGGRR